MDPVFAGSTFQACLSTGKNGISAVLAQNPISFYCTAAYLAGPAFWHFVGCSAFCFFSFFYFTLLRVTASPVAL